MHVIRIYPLANIGERSGLFFVFLGAAGLDEGDVENDRDLEINDAVFVCCSISRSDHMTHTCHSERVVF